MIDVHREGSNNLLTLTGIGDPSGRSEGFAFIRELERPKREASANAPDGADKPEKLTGTGKDLRALTMWKMEAMLRSYGMAQEDIDNLKRWDRVYMIREFSNRVAADGLASGEQAQFARSDKLKASERREVYNERLQEIWRRQRDALTATTIDEDKELLPEEEDVEENRGEGEGGGGGGDDDDDDDDDDDIADDLLEQLDSNQAAAKTAAGMDQTTGIFSSERGDGMREHINNNKSEAAELEAFKAQLREQKEERKNSRVVDQEALEKGAEESAAEKRVVRKKIIKTYPDGTQTVTFQFIVQAKDNAPDVLRVINERRYRKQQESKGQKEFLTAMAISVKQASDDGTVLGHATFADEDEEYDQAFKLKLPTRKTGKKRGGGAGATNKLRLGELQSKRDGGGRKRQKFDNDDFNFFRNKRMTTGADRRKRMAREAKVRQREDHSDATHTRTQKTHTHTPPPPPPRTHTHTCARTSSLRRL